MKNEFSSLGDPLANQDSERVIRRDGDSGLGQPDFVPDQVRVVSEQETCENKEKAEQELRFQFDQKLKDMQQFNNSWELPHGIKRFLTWLLVFVAAVLGVFVVNQAVGFVANMNQLIEPYRTVAISAMVFFTVIIVAVILSLFGAACRIKKLKPFDIKALSLLQQREDIRRFAEQEADKARGLLIDYLKSYSLNEKGTATLINAGLSSEQVEALSVVRNKLLDKSKPLPAGQWLELFADSYQSILDRAADKRIKDYAVKAGFGTAASPVAFIDQMVVMYTSFAMLKDILKIYNLRPVFGQTAVVLSRSIINIYLSGMVENATESSAIGIGDYLREHCGKIVGGVGKVAGAKAAEAAINGLLIYNLGKRVKKMLQPIRNNG